MKMMFCWKPPRSNNIPSVVFYMLFCVTTSAFRTLVVNRAPPRSVSPRRFFASVTGTVYLAEPAQQEHHGDEVAVAAPAVTLFTKEGCTLCDMVKEVLFELRTESPHSLVQRDITDDPDVYERYKYDIPVLHIDGQYWAKHRLTADEAREGLRQAREKTFRSPPGEPNAGKLERTR